MGRNVKIRTSYDHDMQFLIRLKMAVETDRTRPEPWRSGLMTSLQECIEQLVMAPAPDMTKL